MTANQVANREAAIHEFQAKTDRLSKLYTLDENPDLHAKWDTRSKNLIAAGSALLGGGVKLIGGR